MTSMFYIFLLFFCYRNTNGEGTTVEATSADHDFTRPLKLQRVNTFYVPSHDKSEETFESFEQEQDKPEIQEEAISRSQSSKTLSKKRSSIRSNSSRVLQLCSIRDADMDEWKSYANELDCITLVDDTKECRHQIKPKIVKKFHKCGNGGTMYDFQYDICVANYEFILHESGPEITHTTVYSICFDEKARIPLYTEHDITSTKPVRSTRPKNFVEKLQTYMNEFTEDLDDIAAKYEKITKISEQTNDYLMPQMLVPLTDINPMFVREANLHYINVRLQYGRLIQAWNSMNELVWKNLNNYKPNSKVKIYTGASEKLIVDEKEVATVSKLWWKLIKTDDKNVQTVIVFYNVPMDYELSDADYLCTSEEGSCLKGKDHIWMHIDKLNKSKGNIHVQCCPMTNEVLRRIGLTVFITNIEDPEVKRLIDNVISATPYFFKRGKSKLNVENEVTEGL